MKTSSSNIVLYLIILISISTQITPTLAIQRRSTQATTYNEFIKTSCKATLYPEPCYNSLSTYASAIQTSPRSLANAALSVTLATVKTTKDAVARMSKYPGLRSSEAGPMRDCLDLLRCTVEELQNSITEIGQIEKNDIGMKMNNIQTWVSAALTNEDTCMEGFGGNMDSKVKNVMRGKIVNICHLTSNALAFINSFASSIAN